MNNPDIIFLIQSWALHFPFRNRPLRPRRSSAFALFLSAGVLGVLSAQGQSQTAPPTAEQFHALEQKVLELEQELKALKAANQPGPTGATSAANTPAAKLDALDAKVKTLEQNQATAQAAEAAKAKTAPKINLDERGFTFASADDNFKLRLRGYVQADGRFYLNDSAHLLTDTFLLNRVRPVLEGSVFKNYDFKFMPDFGQGKAVIQDAYLDAHFSPWLNVLAGKYKAPVGLERMESARDLTFVERSLPTDIAPNRDIGLWLHGSLIPEEGRESAPGAPYPADLLGYALGVANGAADGSSDDTDENDSKDIEWRLFSHPFKHSGLGPLAGLGLGVAGTIGNENGTAPAYKTVGQQTFFSFNSGVTARGDRTRISPQGDFYWGPFGLLGEYIVSSEDVSKGALSKRLDNSAWQVTASYVLTGEKASYYGVAPKHPFSPGQGQWGSLELATRVGQLDVDHQAFQSAFADPTKSASQAFDWGVGLNWYLNRGVKFVLDYDQTSFEGGAAHGNQQTEHALFTRVQVAF